MSLIEKLTPEQEARLPEYVDKWTKIGLCTDPADRPAAEAAINLSYKAAGLKPPNKIVWCGSPLSQGITRAIIMDKRWNSIWNSVRNSVGNSVGDSVGDSVRNSVRDSVRASVWNSVRDSVRASVWNSIWNSVWDSIWNSIWNSVGDSIWNSVRDSVWDSVGNLVRNSVRASVRASVWNSVGDSIWNSVRASVGTSVGDSVRDSVRNSVGDSVRASVWDSVRDSVWDSVYGQHDAHWLAIYDFYREELALTSQTDKPIGLTNLAKAAGWALPHENICWVSERHHVLERDSEGRLHCEDGPAVMYPDGWAIYAVHGVRVPSEVIEKPIAVPQIEKEQNAEIRRVMIERYGEGRYMEDSGAEKISEYAGGILYRKDLDDDEPIVSVRVVNSTPEPTGEYKVFWLRVPPDMNDAREAVAWTFVLAGSDYRPLIES